jgi:hypothetical protein
VFNLLFLRVALPLPGNSRVVLSSSFQLVAPFLLSQICIIFGRKECGDN